jgi:hypothetical protein
VTRQVGLALVSGVTAALVLTAIGVTAAGGGSPAAPAAARTFDRAYLCTNERFRGSRQIDLFARTGYFGPGPERWLGRFTIGSQGRTPTRIGPDKDGRFWPSYIHWTFAVGAGMGTPTNPLDHAGLDIWANWARACKVAPKGRVQLSARGLSGGAVDYFGDRYKCPAPRRVYVCVRTVFGTAAPFRRDRRTGFLEAEASVHDGRLVMGTEAGKPFVYASVNSSGQARLFTAPSCVLE